MSSPRPHQLRDSLASVACLQEAGDLQVERLATGFRRLVLVE